MTTHHFPAALRTLPVLEDELRRKWPNLRQMILGGFILQSDLALTVLTRQGALHHDCLVHLLGQSSRRLLAVLISGFAPWTLGVVARLPLREGGGLALAPPPQLLDEFFQLLDLALQPGDLALLLRDSAAKLSVLLKEFLISRHVDRRLDHARKRDSSPCGPAGRQKCFGGRRQ